MQKYLKDVNWKQALVNLENIVDPDQMAPDEVIWPEPTFFILNAEC